MLYFFDLNWRFFDLGDKIRDDVKWQHSSNFGNAGDVFGQAMVGGAECKKGIVWYTIPLFGVSVSLLTKHCICKNCCLQRKTYQNFHQGLLLPCVRLPEPWLITFPIRRPFSGFPDQHQNSRSLLWWQRRHFVQVLGCLKSQRGYSYL